MSATFAAVELPHAFGRVELQLERMERALAGLSGVDFALFPEAIVTGYVSPRRSFDLAPFAEPLDGSTRARFATMAKTHGIALGAPLIEASKEGIFNTLLMFDKEGTLVARYRKRHPWYPESWATAGDEASPVVELAGVQVTVGICFDVHFLEDEARATLDRADVLLFPSAWVDDTEEDARGPLLRGLATRHGLTIVNANWGLPSADDSGELVLRGMGGTRVVTPDGASFQGLIARATVP